MTANETCRADVEIYESKCIMTNGLFCLAISLYINATTNQKYTTKIFKKEQNNAKSDKKWNVYKKCVELVASKMTCKTRFGRFRSSSSVIWVR